MVIDVILDHLTDVEDLDTGASTTLTKQEIEWLKAYDFEDINKVLDADYETPEAKDYCLKRELIKYIVNQDYNIELIPRILKIKWI